MEYVRPLVEQALEDVEGYLAEMNAEAMQIKDRLSALNAQIDRSAAKAEGLRAWLESGVSSKTDASGASHG